MARFTDAKIFVSRTLIQIKANRNFLDRLHPDADLNSSRTKFKGKKLKIIARYKNVGTVSSMGHRTTTGPCDHCAEYRSKLIVLKYFSLLFTLFEPYGAVFIMNSKIHLRKKSSNEYFKTISHYFRVYSL